MTTMVDHLGSSYAAVLISILMLALAGVTRFGIHLKGIWHVIYVASAGAALYFNVLIGVVGAFSQTEPSVIVIQLAVVLPFVATTLAIVKRSWHGAPVDRTLDRPRTN
jgi:hypothetical protein